MSGDFSHAVVNSLLVVSLAAMLTGCQQGNATGTDNLSGDAKQGADLVRNYGCGGCHTIPGIAGADGNVGPPLNRVGTRTYIAGFLHNSPDNMAFWIENPQKVLPGSAMPQMGISAAEARDIAAFLSTLK
ncbi:c-type cytochrome [Bradyrhizobium sp. 21]|uniref:c-type cytochrome n=1 Tax=Bradyrhizobium sp. 21 TaxID=2782666 RepID=UPI001FFA6571|nr:c-type cytochrome [Bradyrhizobium sp. 21]MCK1387626.1 c-type cytochrome [Bradyrhizobium sp. 21]